MAPVADPPPILPLVADPHRWRLLTELARSDRRVGELSRLVGQPQNAVSYHLGVLRRAGVVHARRSSADGRDVYYRADLVRCRDLLGATGAALHPGIHLVPSAPADPVPGRRQPPRVLFLCTGNSARSQMAKALLEDRSGHSITAHSAGSHPKPLHPDAVRVMADRGIDIAGRPTTHLRRYVGQRFDLVVTVCDKVREVCPELPGASATSHWSMPDPSAGDGTDTLPAFERTADELEERIALLIADLSAHPSEGKPHAR